MTSLDRQAACPSCGANVTFKFAGARSVVCEYCKAVVARTDRGLENQGRMADLIEIPTPLVMGATGQWNGEMFEVIARLQMDRANAPGAPWQEILIWFPREDRTTWVAYAQGRWYATTEVPAADAGSLPPADSLRPGGQVHLGQHGSFVVAEVAQRRVVAGQGSMSSAPKPGVVTHYADISGPDGRFGTIDYGDGSAPPVLYLGSQFDPTAMKLDSGLPLEAPEAEAAAVECPNCGASFPLLSQQTERIVCQYCGTASDVSQGNLSALGPAPKPPIEPYIPIGSRGNLRGIDYVVCGFVVRGCMVEGIRYSWREYLLFGGESAGYRWLMEEDGKWTFVEPIEAGDVLDSGHGAVFRGGNYNFKQQVQATVEFVIGEFYWKVEIGESVEATEFEGPGGKVSRERTAQEVTYSFVSHLPPAELAAFGVTPPAGAAMGAGMFDSDGGFGGDGEGSTSNILVTIVVIIVICLILAVAMGGGCGGGYGGGSYGGSGYGK